MSQRQSTAGGRIAGIKHSFNDPALLQRALTHRSAGRPHNERLEFLGDSLLNAVVAEALFARCASADEGALTRLRASLVNGETLADIARGIGLGDQLHLGMGELRSGGFRRDSILADALEAVIGAVYLDAGWDACRDVVLALMGERLASASPANAAKDAKTLLQERLQARQLPLPSYTLLEESGEDHAPLFRARCEVADLDLAADGDGGSKRAAEQAAARRLLERLDIKEKQGQ
jgi:ribonuclease III